MISGVVILARTTAGLRETLSAYGLLDVAGELPGFHALTAEQVQSELGVSCIAISGGVLYHRARPRGRPAARYHALLPHHVFEGPGLEPVWVGIGAFPVAAWLERGGRRYLLIGVDVVEEIVRHRQGDPAQVHAKTNRAAYDFDNERPLYLYEPQLVPQAKEEPWADRLGFLVVEAWSRLTGAPIAAALPHGARGAVALTGDDDQAWLETYDDQLRTIGDFPITYFMHPLTKHTADTLRKLPKSVEIGVHPDALDAPALYRERCIEQTAFVRKISQARVRVVRNHGFLSDGYQGHFPAWADAGIELDSNLPGLDGRALNGSYLPGPVRREDGTWSTHQTLLTTFGDGMLFVLKLSDAEAAGRMRALANRVETDHPAVLCLNFHPQNIAISRAMHREALSIARRPGWTALGLETYLDWLKSRASLQLTPTNGRYVLTGPTRDDLHLRIPVPSGFQTIPSSHFH